MKITYCLHDESFKLYENTLQDPYRIQESTARTSLRMVCGRRDFAAFQIAVCADTDYALCIGRAPYFSQNIRRQNIRVCVHFSLPTELFTEQSFEDVHNARYADLLDPADAKEFNADQVSMVYVRIPVSEHVSPGEYTGTVRLYSSRLFEQEVLLGEMNITLKVFPYVLPAPDKGKFFLDLWQHNSNIARKADVKLWSDEHFAVLDRYLASLGALGQRSLTLVVSEIPWGGQGCHQVPYYKGNLYEYSIIPVTKRADGTFLYDFTLMQRYIDLGKKHGIREEISLYGLTGIWGEGIGKPAENYPDALRVRYYDEASDTYRYMTEADQIDSYIRAIADYFVKTGQIQQVRVSADEPSDTEAFRASIEHVRKIAPVFHFKTAINHAEFVEEFREQISDFVPHLPILSHQLDRFHTYQKQMPQKRFLWYVCCGPDHPNTFLCSPLTESYLIGVLTSYFRLDGFLRWNYTVWPDDPRHDLRFRVGWPTGDVNFVYPANNGSPLLSLRYYALRRAIQLYELLETYRKRAGVRKYEEQLHLLVRPKEGVKEKVYTYEGYILPEYEAFMGVYETILQALSK